jgi:beta-alanine degradation protein BauB
LKERPPAFEDNDFAAEVAANQENGCVGRHIVLENLRLRVWRTRLRPSERLAFHKHTLDHLWIAQDDCNLISISPDGKTEQVVLKKGEVTFRRVAPQQSIVRTVLNEGLTEATIIIVEFLDSANDPLPVPEHVRLR